jgi:hypothetical protein
MPNQLINRFDPRSLYVDSSNHSTHYISQGSTLSTFDIDDWIKNLSIPTSEAVKYSTYSSQKKEKRLANIKNIISKIEATDEDDYINLNKIINETYNLLIELQKDI